MSEQSTFEIENQAEEFGHRWNGESIRRSIDLFRQASENWELLKNPARAVENLHRIVRQYFIIGNYQKALQTLEEASRIELKSKNTSQKIKNSSLFCLTYLKLGKTAESRDFFEKVRTLIRSENDFSAQAMAYGCLAEYYYVQRDFVKSIEYFEMSADLWKKTGDFEQEAQSLVEAAATYMTTGDYLIGLEKVRAAEKIFQNIKNDRGLASSYIITGHIYNTIDEKQLALEAYKKAENLFPEDIGILEKARLYNGIGLIYEDYLEWKLSLDYRKKALELFQREQYLYGQLATLTSLIELSFLTADDLSAAAYFEEIKKLSAIVRENYFMAIALRVVGDQNFRSGDYPEALSDYNKSLIILERSGSKYDIADLRYKIGAVYERLGQLPTARRYYNLSLNLSRQINYQFTEAQITYNLALLNKTEGKHEEAFDLIKTSVELTEKISRNFNNSKLTGNYFSNVFARYELYINLLMQKEKDSPKMNYAVAALQAAEKSRAREMLETLSLAEADLTRGADAETVRREKEIRILLNTKADKLTDLLSENAEKSEIGKISTEIRELENKLEEIKAELRQNSPVYSAIKNPAPFDVVEFQQNVLDDNSLLLEFSFGQDESYLWVIGKNDFNSYVLPPREELETQIQYLRELLASREMKKDEAIEDYQARVATADSVYRQKARDLSKALFGQIAGKLSGKRLLIVPDGKLNYFPVSALPLPDSLNDEPILLTNEIIYEPSAQTLSILSRSQNQPSSAAAGNLLIFSDPIFTETDSRMSAETGAAENSNPETASSENFRFVESLNSLVRLTASKDEAEAIISIIGDSKTDGFSGFGATREKLLNTNIADYKIIHFATHGLINEERPELSGIVLSRFDAQGQKLDEFVRLHDIYGLNLNSDLVVLSACNTGIGKDVKGEGLMSLNNAFLQSGAKSVVSSLWKVEDTATLELMKNFYESLVRTKATPAKALQEAQQKMWHSERFQSPFYWAAFTVQGDFKRPLDLSNDSGSGFYLLIPVLVIFLYGIREFYKRRKVS